MKMIASTKVPRAQRSLAPARAFGACSHELHNYLESADKDKATANPSTPVTTQSQKTQQPALLLAVSSDRGLCGGIHTGVARAVRRQIRAASGANAAPAAGSQAPPQQGQSAQLQKHLQVAVVGDKARLQLVRDATRKHLVVAFNQVGKNVPSFADAVAITETLFANVESLRANDGSAKSAEAGEREIRVLYNSFKSAIAYEPAVARVPPAQVFTPERSPALLRFESGGGAAGDVSAETLAHYHEFTTAATVYWCLIEGYASEVSARRTAMDNATKNAGEIINKLTMKFNRQRQAAITNDLVDIITGASAV